MDNLYEILRVFTTQAFTVVFLLLLIPLTEPVKKKMTLFIISSIILTAFNGLLIVVYGREFYTRIFFFTMTLPHVFLIAILSVYKWGKLIFALISVQIIGNIAITNGLFVSYLVVGGYDPLYDLIGRTVSNLVFLPIFILYVRPVYFKMAMILKDGWRILNATFIIDYVLTYTILFIPDPIFNRPLFFIHAYIVIVFSLSTYMIVFYLFKLFEIKMYTGAAKDRLSNQVASLARETEVINAIAFVDGLTGLRNRYSLYRQLDHYIARSEPFSVLFIDLDNFKDVNDRFDHAKGDDYLKQFALALENTIGPNGEVYRFAGDEFVCILKCAVENYNQEHLEQTLNHHFISDLAFLGVSCGISSFPNDATTVDHLINIADQAMYKVKRERKLRR